MRVLVFAGMAIGAIASVMVLSSCSSRTAVAGPNGGDVVPIQSDGTVVKAEVLANAETGEVMVHAWDRDLENARPIPAQSMTLGDGERVVELAPRPLASDPVGRSSRFYGQAEWLRGGSVSRGWLQCCGGQGERQDFAWLNCWSGGRAHGPMWSGMDEHRHGREPMGGPMGEGMGGHQ